VLTFKIPSRFFLFFILIFAALTSAAGQSAACPPR
jgi:hypothetical protein